MHFAIENTTRLFSVVGAPYIAESHSDECCDERATRSRREPEARASFASPASWWLHDGR